MKILLAAVALMVATNVANAQGGGFTPSQEALNTAPDQTAPSKKEENERLCRSYKAVARMYADDLKRIGGVDLKMEGETNVFLRHIEVVCSEREVYYHLAVRPSIEKVGGSAWKTERVAIDHKKDGVCGQSNYSLKGKWRLFVRYKDLDGGTFMHKCWENK